VGCPFDSSDAKQIEKVIAVIHYGLFALAEFNTDRRILKEKIHKTSSLPFVRNQTPQFLDASQMHHREFAIKKNNSKTKA